MKRYQRLVFAACIAGVLPFALSSAVTAQARQCSTERPSNARSYWSYRLIDGRKCWYEGQPMLPKSMLHWSPAQPVQADVSEREPSVLPAARYNFLDAQASMPDDSDSFEARWRQRFLEAVGK
jgi:hypothetical protein